MVDSWRWPGGFDSDIVPTYHIIAINNWCVGIWVYMEQQTHVRGEVKMQVLQYQISNQLINDIEDICFGCRCKELVCL